MAFRILGCGLLVLLPFVGGCGPQPTEDRPVASVVYAPLRGEVPLEVTFDGSFSTASGATIAAYAWSFGDGTTGEGPTSPGSRTRWMSSNGGPSPRTTGNGWWAG